MIKRLVAVALAIAAPAAPVQAQGEWRHDASGISIPRQIGEMRLREEQDNSGGAGTDVIMQFGGNETVVTFYVYRAAYPNAALWFERTRIAMAQTVSSSGIDVEPRSFTLGGASSPNGLREELEVPANRMNVRATAVAIAHIGEWIVKARISSRTLDREGVRARMDQLLAAVRFARPPAAALPLRVPGPCPDDNRMRAARIGEPEREAITAAIAGGAEAFAEARGRRGLASDPQSWCRDRTQVPVQYGTVYRRRDGTGWVTLLGDSGIAVSANRLDLPGRAGAALYASTTASTQLAGLYEDVPHPDVATPEGIPVLVGQARGLGEVPERPNR